ncbi:MAG: hypothetical protein GY764_08345 [Halieaceae bacterium]|nr:hypothetical protein [Halieaceae bacterium]
MPPDQHSLRDFDRARRKAFIQHLLALFSRKSLDLLPFDTVQERLRLRNKHFRGLQEVPLDAIAGSVGRYKDFTRTFFPRKGELRQRWAAVEALVKTGGLPPVELYQVGQVYFVWDGNHRVSVARSQGAPAIEAYVWEYPSPVPLHPDDDLDDLIIKQEYMEFLERTQLHVLHPEQQIEFTAPARYRDLLEHIAVHRYYLNQEQNQEIPAEEAVSSWYANVYQPIIRAIRKQDILKQFPGRTEADFYVWASRWQHELGERYNKSIGAEDAVDDFIERGNILWL